MMLRDEIIDFLKYELVGPRPGLPFVQINGEEVLPPEAPPRLRYGAGILFPSLMEIDDQEDDSVAIDASTSNSVDEEDENTHNDLSLTGEQGPLQDERGESQSELDADVRLANEFLPSALGITCLMRLPKKIKVSVNAAQYIAHEVQGYKTTKNNKDNPRKCWFRVPVNQVVNIDCNEFIGNYSYISKKWVLQVANEGSSLELNMLSRPVSIKGEFNETTDRFITFTLINRTVSSYKQNDENCFFQCSLSVCEEDGNPCIIQYPEREEKGLVDYEDLTLELLYRHKNVYGVGHGCSINWKTNANENGDMATEVYSSSIPEYEIRPILPSGLNGIDLRMVSLSDDKEFVIKQCSNLADQYEEWILNLVNGELSTVPSHLDNVANKNIQSCTDCLMRIRNGIKILEKNDIALEAFQLMNRAMLMQHAHYELSTSKRREWVDLNGKLILEQQYEKPIYEESIRAWRPFQLAFVLLTIASIVLDDEGIEERDIVDLIWFPTGGGKTEAYLGLTAFTIFWRRLNNPNNAGTTALMRYTLRLLTTQQYERAASLICACEILRSTQEDRLGRKTISIGLWVGGRVTPNTEKAALSSFSSLLRGDSENPFIVSTCPWCGSQMGPVKVGRMTKVKGYKKLTSPNRIRLVCDDPNCEFSNGEGLPLSIIDEHIYSEPPTLVIGTVDKFALLPWYYEARRLFGIGIDGYSPPDLVIQDELHLISGPLGSMVGHYETIIDELTRRKNMGRSIKAKIVASTATISHADDQVSALYGGRKSFLFPPQALKAGDSFFAEERGDLPGRKYVGIFATGLPSLTTTEVRVLSALLQAPKHTSYSDETEIDPYWTLMVYFNSIRELGHAATLIRGDIAEYMSVIWKRLGLTHGWGEEQTSSRRFIASDMELTSRVQNSEIKEYMNRLFLQHGTDIKKSPVDICIATNMIQVGLDVPRLGLMAIVGQPKTVSEYIQASSRVGRSDTGPGLVVTLLNPAKPRDRSHAENFCAFHQSIYRYVEPTSVTPFAIPVSERALHALIVTLARYWGDDGLPNFPDPPPDNELENIIRRTILNRVSNVDPGETERISAMMDNIFSHWHEAPPRIWGTFSPDEDTVPFMYPYGYHAFDMWSSSSSYPTPSSMRNVDANCNARIIGSYFLMDDE